MMHMAVKSNGFPAKIVESSLDVNMVDHCVGRFQAHVASFLQPDKPAADEQTPAGPDPVQGSAQWQPQVLLLATVPTRRVGS